MNSWMTDQPFDAAVRMRLFAFVLLSTLALTACSKSPSSVVAHAANAIGQRLMQPLVQKTASSPERVNEIGTPGVMRLESKRVRSRVVSSPFSAD